MKSNNSKNTLSLEEQEQKLLASLEAIRQKQADAKAAKLKETENTVNSFPSQLGVSSLAEVIALIKHVEKGTLGREGAKVGSRGFNEMTDTLKASVVEYLTKNPAAQNSEVSALFNVAPVAVWHIRKDNAALNPAPAETATV